MPAGLRHDFSTYGQYSYLICSRLEEPTDAIPGLAVVEIGLGVRAKLGGSGSNRSCDIRPAQFVVDEQQRSMKPPAKKSAAQ